ncbi:class A beta-lactamase [Francisella tularensis]|uniref:class A beta-lactamase n=1 Tax=Francisella tularensis TaxID=263 RepID=UPI000173E403|nr:class A beta-lactamase [Francisella tularensis]ACD31058.1 beta-lactamase class A [Francisella tularensis subsp. mediasiatica FSC147]MBK2078654.1 class A beta-lactamase [Francisella tularensis subsp. mediasiatica]MBK2101146.1 class A beta-lactamase [Francisella tularensis subsp. mediasiatica]MBK2104782.1 class A beta-lactamase [Francisella tularensis subsp. mediasiatica]MDN9003957.1 class A beta-lactamase [Francisella tularensis subsp. mediasiatica]
MKKIITLIIGIIFITFSFATTKIDTQVTNDIQNIEKKYGGKIGVYTINRNDWNNFAVNASFYFPICSTYKFLVVGAILKQSMTDNKLLNQKIKISKNQIVEYSPITRRHINQIMTVKQLCQASMQGDNTATNILIEKLGGLKNLNKFNLSLADHATKVANLEPKVNHVSLTTNENKTTPKIMARDINKLAFSDDILDKKHRLMFKQWLIASNTSNNRIAAEVPDEWEVGDKTGTCQYGTTNDVAIIWPDDNRAVIMAIFYTQSQKNAKPNSKIVREVTKILLNRLQLNNTTKNA